jgi:hypothetical protein
MVCVARLVVYNTHSLKRGVGMKELIDQLTRCPKVGGTYMVPDYLVSEIEQTFVALRATVKKANESVGIINDVVNGESK